MTSESFGKKFPSGAPFSFFSLLLPAVLLLLTSCSGPDSAPLSKNAALAAPEQAHALALKAGLAASKEFYVELSLRDKELRLCHSGVFLRKYKINEAALQGKRFLFFGKARLKNWNNRLWEDGRFSPPQVVERIRIIPGDESTRPTPGKPGILPPTMEEITPVPSSFSLEFPQSFAIRFDLEGDIPGKAADQKKTHLAWNDFLVGLGLRKGPAARLMIRMDAKEGAAFFRSCPLNAPFLILP